MMNCSGTDAAAPIVREVMLKDSRRWDELFEPEPWKG